MAETIEQRVTPYGHLAYGEQLKKKHEWLRGVLGALGNSLEKEIKRGNEIAPHWYRQSKEMPLSDDIIHSDALEGYRNKVEFTVGYQYAPPRDGENELWSKGPVCVGFNRGNLAKGISFVEKPDSIKVNSAESLIVAKKFEKIVAESGLTPYDKSVNRGFWRILVYRESKVTKQVLICVVVSKQTEDNKDVRPLTQGLKDTLISEFRDGTPVGDKGYKICSLSVIYATDLSGGYKEGDEWEVLSGTGHYEEVLCGFRFTVSPFAFF